MNRSIVIWAFAACSSALCVSPAVAAPAQSVRQACRADAMRLCGDVQPGGGRIVACMREHEQALSPACSTALQKMSNAAPAQ